MYLYIKQHNKTGLRYFGKTIKDPTIYRGSGKLWTKHLNKHGKDISTIWYHKFNEVDDMIEFAKFFSDFFNIVEDSSWANLAPENGTDGGPRTNSYFKEFNKQPKSKELREKISNSCKGVPKNINPHKNENISKTLKNTKCRLGFNCSVYDIHYKSIKKACSVLQITRYEFSKLESLGLAKRT